MSGGNVRITVGSTEYEVPEDKAQTFMRALDNKGTKFTAESAPKVEGEMTVGAPEAIKPEDQSIWGHLSRSIRDNSQPALDQLKQSAGNVADTAGDAASHLVGGWTANLDQRIPFGIGDAIRKDRAEATARSPETSGFFDMAGTLTSPVGIEGKAAGVAGRIGNQMLNGALQGGARAVGDTSSDDDLKTQAWKVLAGTAAGGGVGLALGGASEGLGALATPIRRYAVGGTAGDYGEIMREQGTRSGIDYISRDLGKIPDQQGLSNLIFPKSKAGYAKSAATRNAEVVGPRLGDSLDRAAGEIPQPKTSTTFEAMHPDVTDESGAIPFVERTTTTPGAIQRDVPRGELVAQRDALNKARRPGGGAIDQAIGQMDAAPFETPRDVHKLKTQYEAEAYAPNAVARSYESDYAQGQNAAATATRSHLSDIMDSAHPETAAQFHQANRDYADTTLIEKLSRKGAAGDFARPLAGAALGGGIGAYEGHTPQAGIEGAFLGAAAGHIGADLAANILRRGESALGSSAVARLGGQLAGQSASELLDNGRGQEIPRAIQDALRSGQLGPYANQFAKAAMSQDSGALGSLYSSLSLSDPNFKPYQRLLQGMTAEGSQ